MAHHQRIEVEDEWGADYADTRGNRAHYTWGPTIEAVRAAHPWLRERYTAAELAVLLDALDYRVPGVPRPTCPTSHR